MKYEVNNMKFEVPEIEVITFLSEPVTNDDLPGVSGDID